MTIDVLRFKLYSPQLNSRQCLQLKVGKWSIQNAKMDHMQPLHLIPLVQTGTTNISIVAGIQQAIKHWWYECPGM